VTPVAEQFYTSGEYLARNPTWHVEHSAWKATQILRAFERNGLEPRSVCEVGCGAGEVLSQLYLRMPDDVRFVGYEISPQAFELCRARKRDRLEFRLGNFVEANVGGADVVLAIDLIEHVEDCLGFLRALRERGKYKVFHIPLDISVHTVLRNVLVRKREAVGHLHYFTMETALATLRDTGYQIADYFYTPVCLAFPAPTLKSHLARLPTLLMYRLNAHLTVRVVGGFSLMVVAR
jgi:SAM-dependent methyltransferase